MDRSRGTRVQAVSFTKPSAWSRVTLMHRYTNLCARLNSKEGLEVLKHVKTITLREGFRSPSDICMFRPLYRLTVDTILSNPTLIELESISILPDYPTSFDPLVSSVPTFPFGLQLVRTQKPIKALCFGLPLELSTNAASRQHLKVLRPPKLTITLSRPNYALLTELRDSVAEITQELGIRYVPTRTLIEPEVLFCKDLQSFRHINLFLHLPRPPLAMVGPPGGQTLEDDPAHPITRFTASLLALLEGSSAEVQARYTVWKVEGWETAGQVESATRTKIWPTAILFDHEFEFDSNAPTPTEEKALPKQVEPAAVVKKNTTQGEHWERETNLRLFGGLFNLSLESKRHGPRK